jgi:uncharacterized protein
MERRTTAELPATIEQREGESTRIRGYAAVFYDGTSATEYPLWSRAVERIMPGAFDKAMARDDVRALFNHDPNMLLGRSKAGTLKLVVDAKGLAYEIEPGDTSVARDVLAHLKRKDITGSSFAFVVTDENWDKKEDGKRIREIRGVELYDVGPVTYPAYKGTTAAARSDSDIADARQRLEQIEADEADQARRRNEYQRRARLCELGL